jgi:hypothetical protein
VAAVDSASSWSPSSGSCSSSPSRSSMSDGGDGEDCGVERAEEEREEVPPSIVLKRGACESGVGFFPPVEECSEEDVVDGLAPPPPLSVEETGESPLQADDDAAIADADVVAPPPSFISTSTSWSASSCSMKISTTRSHSMWSGPPSSSMKARREGREVEPGGMEERTRDSYWLGVGESESGGGGESDVDIEEASRWREDEGLGV